MPLPIILQQCIEDIADGHKVDWKLVNSKVPDKYMKLIPHLKVIEKTGQFHQKLHRQQSTNMNPK